MRGGVAVIFKNQVWRQAQDICRLRNQVWFRISSMPCYRSFSDIQEQISATDDKVIILEDLNSRIPNINTFNNVQTEISFTENTDKRQNANGKDLTNICTNLFLYLVNHLCVGRNSFPGRLTFRQSESWICQIDWAICPEKVIPDITNFDILNETPLKTNHADYITLY